MSIRCKIGLHTWESGEYLPELDCYTLDCSLCGKEKVVNINKEAIIKALIILYQRGSITSGSFRRIGEDLNRMGGYELMLDIANEAVSQGVSSRWFNDGWDGIGGWLS
jgi:hypothetical protein